MIDMSFNAKLLTRGAVALFAVCAAHGQAQAPAELKALQQLQPGLWEFKSKDAAANKTMCITDLKTMFQLRHQGQSCRRFVIANEQNIAKVYYSCPATGNGQTTLRVETPRLVQVDSQGMVARSPFTFSAEGRRISACAPRVVVTGR